MRYALLATTLLATPAVAQNTASFAAQNCPGETFYDDFSQNTGKWSFGGGGSLSDGNDAFASYQSSTQNQTEQFTSSGLDLSILPMPAPNGAQWQAGLMNTQNTFSQTYGYFEAAVNIPQNMLQPGATWAFWLIGYHWPPEIDIAEFSTTNGNEFDNAVHSSDPHQHTVYEPPIDGWGTWHNFLPGNHVFAVDWRPDGIDLYVDGTRKAYSNTPSDMRQPMYIVLGSAAHSNISSPATLQVMYVRVFKDMNSALACVPKAPTTPSPQIISLNNRIQQVSTQSDQLQATIPNVPAIQAPATSQVPGYDPQFFQAGQQMQQQLQAIQAENASIPLAAPPPQTLNPTLSPPQSLTTNRRHPDNDGDADDR